MVVFFLALHLTNMLDGTNRNQIKLLIIKIVVNVSLSYSFPRKIFSGVRSHLIQLFDLLFKRQICSLQVLNELVLRLHQKNLLVKSRLEFLADYLLKVCFDRLSSIQGRS